MHLCSPVQRRVVITGAGIITSLGCGWDINATGFRAGLKAFRDVSLFDVSRQRVRRAGEVAGGDLPPVSGGSKLDQLDRAYRLLHAAASEALSSSNLNTRGNMGCILGTTSGGMPMGEEMFKAAVANPSSRWHQPGRIVHYLATHQADRLRRAFGLGGPSRIVSNACASGANAIGHGWNWIRSGRCDRVLAGGYDTLSQLVFAGFDSLQALSTTSCRPFSSNRDGLSLGEGAGVLVLEELESAQKRGASILAELSAYSSVTDLHHLTQPHPEGKAALVAMQSACKRAGITPGDVDYLNAHGTGTVLNDSAEAAAINSWAGPTAVERIKVSSTKASIGHLLGAAGAVEAVICVMAIAGQWIPPQISSDTPDPVCKFKIVTRPTDAKVDVALSNSFGFGGANASLIFKRL